MRRVVLASSLCALLMSVGQVSAQEPQPAPGPPIPGAPINGQQVPVTSQGPGPAPNAPAPQTLYPVKSANIRAGAGKTYNVIGKLTVGQPVQVLGMIPGTDWYQLASGGFVSASVLSPTPVVVAPVHPRPIETVPPPSSAYYPVGACEPYSRVVNIGGQPNQINGTACKQADGSWRIVNYGVPTPAPGAVVNPAPIAVQPAPVYVQPAPVYVAPPPPVIYERRPYYYHY